MGEKLNREGESDAEQKEMKESETGGGGKERRVKPGKATVNTAMLKRSDRPLSRHLINQGQQTAACVCVC